MFETYAGQLLFVVIVYGSQQALDRSWKKSKWQRKLVNLPGRKRVVCFRKCRKFSRAPRLLGLTFDILPDQRLQMSTLKSYQECHLKPPSNCRMLDNRFIKNVIRKRRFVIRQEKTHVFSNGWVKLLTLRWYCVNALQSFLTDLGVIAPGATWRHRAEDWRHGIALSKTCPNEKYLSIWKQKLCIFEVCKCPWHYGARVVVVTKNWT